MKTTIRSDYERMIERWKMGKEHRERVQPVRSFFRLIKLQWRQPGYWSIKK